MDGQAFVLLVLVASLQAEGPGIKSCKVVTQAGMVDLTPLGNSDGTPRFDLYVDDNNYTYSFNPCYGFDQSVNCKAVELCQHDRMMDYKLGDDNSAEFFNNGTHLFLFYNTDYDVPRSSHIQLICDQQVEGNFTVLGEEPVGQYHFELRSKYACPKALPTTTPNIPTPPTPPTAATGPQPFTNPTPAPRPSPPNIFNLKTITILLGCILVTMCVLICMVFVGLLTRRSASDTSDYPPPYGMKGKS